MKRDLSSRRQRGDSSSWLFAGFALVALFFLLAEHRAHLFGWLPFLLLAACLLMLDIGDVPDSVRDVRTAVLCGGARIYA